MKKLYFDIETLPAGDEMVKILKEIHGKRVKDGKESKTFEDYIEATGLDGSFGRIACIGYAKDDEETQVLYGDEKEILKKFWEIAKNIQLFIGFNVMDFDFKFIFQRSIILKVKPTRMDLSFAKYRNYPIYDVMWEWSKWSNLGRSSLDKLAKALGFISSKGGAIEGKNVAKAYEQGRIKEICEYCKKDVEVTRKIYKRMIFEE
jgi:hypothetical protein